MLRLCVIFFVLLVFVPNSLAEQVITRDLVGDFNLEAGSTALCSPSVFPYYLTHGAKGDSQSIGIDFGFFNNGTNTFCSPSDGLILVRRPASTEVFGAAASSIGSVITSSKPYLCRSRRYPRVTTPFNGTFPQPEFLGNTSFTLTGAIPMKPVTVKGVKLTPQKRYFIATSNKGYCIYSASTLKRIDVRGKYNLVRSPLLKTPPSYCKSSLEIRGVAGEVNSTEMLFDGRPDACLKGTLSFIQEVNITFPAVSKLVQRGIPYYGYSNSPLFCGKNLIYAGAAEISVDASLANVASVRGARYFGMIDTGPRDNYTGILDNLRVCLYTTYNGKSNSIWTWIGSLLGW